jgi:1-acyl-sn-glycerol-3-phosphate acyltransferase
MGAAIIYLCFIYPIIRLYHLKNPQAWQSFTRRYCHMIARALIRYFPYRDSERTFIGMEGTSFDRPAVIVANHVSILDVFVMLSLSTEMVMMVKRWVWNWPVVGWLVRAAGYVLVDGQDVDDVLKLAAIRLNQGAHVMIFPEGSRSRTGRMRRFHKGAFELAVRAQADVIPVLITNSQACLPINATWVGDHRCVIRVLPRISPQTFPYSRSSRELARHVKQQMLEHEHTDWRLAQDSRAFRHSIRSLYNYRGAFVESYVAWKLRLDPLYSRIDEFVPHAGVVVDAGCGYGLLSNIIARKSLGRSVIGIDLDARKIRVAQATALAVPNVQFELGDLLDIQFPQADAVILVDVLHYWSKEKQRNLITKACNAVHPGGVLIFREAYRSKGASHWFTAQTERFATTFGHNHRGDGLHFYEEDFYIRAFESNGLMVEQSPEDVARGSNGVLILRKEP